MAEDLQLSFRKSANIDRVTDKRKDSLFRLVDTDGSGTIDAQEFAVLYDAIKKDLAEELEKEAALQKEASSARRRFKMLLLFVAVLLSFLAASVAANFAVIFTVVDQAITTTTTSTGLLEVKGSDAIVKTATATQDVPLIIAPALDLDTLSQVKSLKVKYMNMQNTIEAQLSVVGMRKHNATFVEFITDVPGETVEALNGVASLVRYPTAANGLRAPHKFRVCAGNASCSAFRASGIDTDAALEVARMALVGGGFLDASRRLDPIMDCTPDPAVGTWEMKIVCGAEWWQVIFPPYAIGHGACNNITGTVAEPALQISKVYTFYYLGYSGLRHFVFLMHGNGGSNDMMWDYYCTFNTQLCPLLMAAGFEHLIFVLPKAVQLDVYTGAFPSWCSTTADHASYNVSASSLAAMIWDAGSGDSFESIYASAGNAGFWSGLPCGTNYDCPPALDVSAASEIMVIGHSNGGGFGMYLNWVASSVVTQVVAMDYWAYAYSGWLVSPAVYDPSNLPKVNAHIFTNCAGGYYAGVPSPPAPGIHVSDAEAIFMTPSYWNAAGMSVLSPGGVVYPIDYGVYPAGGLTSYPQTVFTWVAPGATLKFSVHGIDPTTGYCTANEMQTDNLTAWVGTGFESIHVEVPLYVPIVDEITSWIAPPPPPPSPPPPVPVAAPTYCGWPHMKFLFYYNMFDSDMSGCLDYAELEGLVSLVFPTAFKAYMFFDFDCDGNGCLDVGEADNLFKYLFYLIEGLPFEYCEYYKCELKGKTISGFSPFSKYGDEKGGEKGKSKKDGPRELGEQDVQRLRQLRGQGLYQRGEVGPAPLPTEGDFATNERLGKMQAREAAYTPPETKYKEAGRNKFIKMKFEENDEDANVKPLAVRCFTDC